jgi:large subunit ribosomal protein L4
MTTVDVLNAEGSKAGAVDLPDEIFEVQVNIPLIHQVVVGQLAAARQGTAKAKTRGEVSGGGAKPYRQKGTGRARQGSRRAPHFTGGGVVHGPQPRSYEQRTPKKMKAAALRGALTDRARHGRVHVVSSLIDGDVPSTKTAVATIAKVTDRKNVLVVLHRDEDVAWFSLRNAADVHVLVADQLNTYDVLISDDVVFTAKAYQDFTGIEVEVTKAPAQKTAQKAAAKKAAAKADDTEAADDADEKPAKKAAAKKSAAKKTAKKAAAKADDADAEKEADA